MAHDTNGQLNKSIRWLHHIANLFGNKKSQLSNSGTTFNIYTTQTTKQNIIFHDLWHSSYYQRAEFFPPFYILRWKLVVYWGRIFLKKEPKFLYTLFLKKNIKAKLLYTCHREGEQQISLSVRYADNYNIISTEEKHCTDITFSYIFLFRTFFVSIEEKHCTVNYDNYNYLLFRTFFFAKAKQWMNVFFENIIFWSFLILYSKHSVQGQN